MLTHIIPAASFTAATTAPSLLSRVTDALQWLAAHPTLAAIPLTVAVVLLIAWAFAREARRRQHAVLQGIPQRATIAATVGVPARGGR